MCKRAAFVGLCFSMLSVVPTASSVAAENSRVESEGKAILQLNCARCHSIDATGESPLHNAPPLRDIYLRYPIEQFEQGLAEGLGSRHREMPQIQFSSENIAAILSYLGSLTGVYPSARPTIPKSGEPVPP